MKKKHKMSRRNFLKRSAQAAAAASVAPAILSKSAYGNTSPSPLNQWPGRVIVNYNNTHNATNKGGTASDQTVLRTMVDDAIKLLTEQSTVGQAWKSLFPGITSATKIALKVNFNYNSTIPPHPFVVMGITEGLKQMQVDGGDFPADNIYLYESSGSGSFDGANYTSTLFPSPIHRIAQDSKSNHGDGADNNKPYANTLYNCDYLINVPGIRGHGSGYGSVTMGFKSHFGTYPPNHSSNTHEFLRDTNCTGPVYNKTVLTVFGGIYANNEGHGPGGGPDNFHTYAATIDPDIPSTLGRADTVILSTDPVSAEFQGIKVQKINRGYNYAVSDMPEYLRASAGITGALSTTYNIGTLDESSMDVREIINGNQTTPASRQLLPGKRPDLVIYPNPVNPHSYSFIEINLSAEHTDKIADIDIYNMQGKKVRKLSRPISGFRSRFVWDNRDGSGTAVSAGKYLVKARVGQKILLSSLAVVK